MAGGIPHLFSLAGTRLAAQAGLSASAAQTPSPFYCLLPTLPLCSLLLLPVATSFIFVTRGKTLAASSGPSLLACRLSWLLRTSFRISATLPSHPPRRLLFAWALLYAYALQAKARTWRASTILSTAAWRDPGWRSLCAWAPFSAPPSAMLGTQAWKAKRGARRQGAGAGLSGAASATPKADDMPAPCSTTTCNLQCCSILLPYADSCSPAREADVLVRGS